MTDTAIKAFVNELNLKCPNCGGSVKVNRIEGNNVFLDHNFPGEKEASQHPKCQTLNTEVTGVIASFKNNLMQLPTLRESLTKLAVVRE